MSALYRFLGDTPLRVALKLVVVSFLVGVVMTTFGWSPLYILDRIAGFVADLWAMGFDAFYRFGNYILLGAVLVVPAFILLRLASYRR